MLLDVKKNEILAMVSKPSVQVKGESLYKTTLENQMLTPHFPGSVFKTIIAAAAIDQNENVFNRVFNCNKDLYGEDHPQVKMGTLSFKESFARSCNRTFSELGNELIEKDKMVLETYVAALGGAEKVGWRGSVFHTTHFEQMPEEKSVTIWGVKEIRIVKSGSANSNWTERCTYVTSSDCKYDGDDC